MSLRKLIALSVLGLSVTLAVFLYSLLNLIGILLAIWQSAQ